MTPKKDAPRRSDRRMTQGEFEMRAALAVSQAERAEEIENELKRVRSPSGMTVADIDKAYGYVEKEVEREEIREDLKVQAAEFADAGMPRDIWVQVPREEKHAMKIKLYEDGGTKEWRLKIERDR